MALNVLNYCWYFSLVILCIYIFICRTDLLITPMSDLQGLIANKEELALYRDDGLMILRNVNSRDTDITRKKIIRIFKDLEFQIEIITSLHSANFLDTTLDLKIGTYRPYRKPNDTPLYIHASSNHPQRILKQIPLSINQRLSRNSSNSSIFDKCKDEYEEALKRSGYNNIHLSHIDNQRTKRKNNRTRNIIWFNPPFCKNVSSSIANHSSNSLTNTSHRRDSLYIYS